MATKSDLTDRVKRVVGWSQLDLANAAGVSRRTVQRWDAGQGSPQSLELEQMARSVHAKDRQLAHELAQMAGSSLEALGLATLAPPPGPTLAHLVDSVVCAAADAGGVLPRDVRPILLAAFRSAREMGLDWATVERHLSPPQGKK